MATIVIGDYEYTIQNSSIPYWASARVVDKTKSSYGEIQSSVTYEGVTYRVRQLSYCFYECRNLVTPPAIPSSVQWMNNCFSYCTSMTSAPDIPASVTSMGLCFNGCTGLVTPPPTIPSDAVVEGCFFGCTSLTGNIRVNGLPGRYSDCFKETRQPITLTVTDPDILMAWQQVADTGNYGNVTVNYPESNPAPTATITAVRVITDDPTDPESINPNEDGLYAYVTVRTAVSVDQASDNVARVPLIILDGSTYTPLHPSGTAIYTCWVNLGNNLKHVIDAIPRDLYKSGTKVTITIASTYSPMEFYQGGTGASFGKHARPGVLDVAWPIESDGDVKATAAGATHSLVGKQDVLTAGTGLSKSSNNVLSVTDGNPYCKSGSDVKVNGSTIGSADNLAYVSNIPTACSFTPDYTYADWDTGGTHVYRWGHQLTLQLMGALKANLAAWQNRRIGTLSPAPPHTTSIYCYSNDSIPRLIQIGTDGSVTFRTLGKAVDTLEGKSFRGCNTIYVN